MRTADMGRYYDSVIRSVPQARTRAMSPDVRTDMSELDDRSLGRTELLLDGHRREHVPIYDRVRNTPAVATGPNVSVARQND